MGNSQPKISTAAKVNVQRFMGDWYVISCIGIGPEHRAYDSLEQYALRPDGSIDVTFSMRDGSPTAPLKPAKLKAFVRPKFPSNSVWDVQLIWPFKAEYLIADLDDDYQTTIVARSRRDYVWIMARTPSISEEEYSRLTQRVTALGYDASKLRKVPQAAR